MWSNKGCVYGSKVLKTASSSDILELVLDIETHLSHVNKTNTAATEGGAVNPNSDFMSINRDRLP